MPASSACGLRSRKFTQRGITSDPVRRDREGYRCRLLLGKSFKQAHADETAAVHCTRYVCRKISISTRCSRISIIHGRVTGLVRSGHMPRNETSHSPPRKCDDFESHDERLNDSTNKWDSMATGLEVELPRADSKFVARKNGYSRTAGIATFWTRPVQWLFEWMVDA